MFIKITQPGWETYNSDLGTVQFENGRSVTEVSRMEALRLGAFVTVQECDADGNELGQISPAVDVLRTSKISATVTAGLERVQTQPSDTPEIETIVVEETPEEIRLREVRTLQAQSEAAGRHIADVAAAPVLAPAVAHTPESLEVIATKDGINGLRAIAPAGVKGTSIKGLMTEILAAQAKV